MAKIQEFPKFRYHRKRLGHHSGIPSKMNTQRQRDSRSRRLYIVPLEVENERLEETKLILRNCNGEALKGSIKIFIHMLP